MITVLDATDIATVRDRVITLEVTGDTDSLLAQAAELARLERAIQARQARIGVRVAQLMTASDREAGIPAERAGAGAGTSLGLARGVSPHRGRVLLSMAKVAHEMPHTNQAFTHGLVDQDRVIDMLRETSSLTLTDRGLIDTELASDAVPFGRMATRTLVGRARARAGELDPAAIAERRRIAEHERRVWIRPAPDTMVYLTALLPMAEGVSAYAALKAAATLSDKPQGQAMADTMVARITGREPGAQPIALQLMMTDTSVLTGSAETAHLNQHGPIPADVARDLLRAGLDNDHLVTLRRLYTRPDTGELIAMESKSRSFPAGLADFIRTRDQHCRTPGCSAPIAEIDHVIPWSHGGPTTADNGQGLCVTCNRTKEQSRGRPTSDSPRLRRTG